MTAASRRGIWEAYAFVQGNASTTFPDGAKLTIDDAMDGLHVRFAGAAECTVTLDLRGHAPLTTRMATGGATLTADPNVIKFKGGGEVVLR